MRILHVCAQEPAFNSGGSLCVYQSHYALTKLYEDVDYAGPAISNKDIECKYKKRYYLDASISKLTKAITLLQLQFDRYYPNWKNANIPLDQYDLIYVEFTKMNYVVKDIAVSGFKGKIILRAHNVERDFYRIELENDRSLLRFMKYKLGGGRERYMTQKADRVLAITEIDGQRFIDIYQIPKEKIVVFPVGVNEAKHQKEITGELNEKIRCLITGSLWFGPNCEGVKWFIEKVWPLVKEICNLTLAGASPLEEIKKLCQKENIHLVESPKSMMPYFENTDMVLVPIFDGGGMKVKIAEAMSYGLPVVTTSHGVIGYAIENGVDGYVTDDPLAFAEAIKTYFNMNDDDRKKILENERKLYRDNYSLEAIERDVHEIIASLE
ncbi:glycosyltransferase family 4 protein [[Clostridium] fimetarium]|nr:glycosyltransferase family 4 protein [[Clostridium] fimetarium]